MNNNQSKILSEKAEFTLRYAIPYIAQNIHEANKIKNAVAKTSLFAREMGNRALEAAHDLNIAAKTESAAEVARIRDTLLTAHYSHALGMKASHINNILNHLPPNDPQRQALEAQIHTIGRTNPSIGSLQRAADTTHKNLTGSMVQSFQTLVGPNSPARRADILRYARKNYPNINKVIP